MQDLQKKYVERKYQTTILRLASYSMGELMYALDTRKGNSRWDASPTSPSDESMT